MVSARLIRTKVQVGQNMNYYLGRPLKTLGGEVADVADKSIFT